MPPLLQKLRRMRPATKRHPLRERPHAGERHRFWLYATVCAAFAIGGYFWITSARIVAEPVSLNYGPEDAAFAGTLGPILGADFTRGNKVTTLVNGDQFFPSMLASIRGAQKSVDLETYIWSSGVVSDQFIAALEDRARNGVKVHALVDGMGSLKLSAAEERRMKSAGIEFVVYGREHWWDVKPNINHRTHRKLLIIDGRIGFTGGCCIDDHWLGNADSPKVWRETQVRVEGPAVLQMQATFAENWLQTTGRLLAGTDYFPEPDRPGDARAQCYRSGPSQNPENARVAYFLAIASARKNIRIANAYFVPDDLAIDMLVRARKRGVRVQILVPAINDSRIGRAASRSRWGKLLEAGAEFYLYEPAMFHCKVMIVDDNFVTVGSVNFDNRSFAINDEVAVDILDPNVAREETKIFDNDLSHSRPLTFAQYESRSIWLKTADRICGMLRSQL